MCAVIPPRIWHTGCIELLLQVPRTNEQQLPSFRRVPANSDLYLCGLHGRRGESICHGDQLLSTTRANRCVPSQNCIELAALPVSKPSSLPCARQCEHEHSYNSQLLTVNAERVGQHHSQPAAPQLSLTQGTWRQASNLRQPGRTQEWYGVSKCHEQKPDEGPIQLLSE